MATPSSHSAPEFAGRNAPGSDHGAGPDDPARLPAEPTPLAGGGDALGAHVTRGFSFMLVQSIASRVVSFACQIALARLLIPEHYGLIALADTIAVFANLLQLIGVREILVSRHRKMRLWIPVAFWITVVIGLLSAGAVAAIAPLTAKLFGQPELTGLMLVIAISLPLWAMSIVPEAKLASDLKFSAMAQAGAIQTVLAPILTVVFAVLGFGPYSFVLPRPIVGLLRLILMLRASGIRIGRPRRIARGRFLVASSSVIFLTSVLLLLVQVGERPILGKLVTPHEVGLYFFAYGTSLQVIMMITVNLEQVLFAALSRLRGQTERLLRAYINASRTLATVVVPLCLLQVAGAEPAVQAVFGAKWLDAVPALQMLSLAMIFLGAYSPANAMLQAQRRFRTRLGLSVVSAVSYLSFVAAGAVLGMRLLGTSTGAVTGAATGVVACYALSCPLWSFVTIRPMGGRMRDVLGIIGGPLLCGALGAAAGWAAGELLARLLPVNLGGIAVAPWARLAGVGGVGCVAAALATRLLMPAEFGEVLRRVTPLARRACPPAGRAMERYLASTPAVG